VRKAENLPPSSADVTESGIPNIPEPSGPHRAVMGMLCFTTFIQGICNYIHEKNHVTRLYNVAAVLNLQSVPHIMLFRMLIMFCTPPFRSRDSSVGIPTSYGLDFPGIESRTEQEHAEQMADLLVAADCRGHYSHSLNRLGNPMENVKRRWRNERERDRRNSPRRHS
jgi:hypothetical protein